MDDDRRGPTVEVHYQNAGHIPANEQFAVGKVFVLQEPPNQAVKRNVFPDWFSTLQKHPSFLDTTNIMGISERRALSIHFSRLFAPADVTAWMGGEKWLYVIGRISYKDDGGSHYSDFCRYYSPPNLNPGNLPSSTPLLKRWVDCGSSDSKPINF